MKEFIYDNTFEGLLTTIFYSYSCKDSCTITKNCEYTPSFLNEVVEITTDDTKYKRVSKSIKENLSYNVLENIYYLYLSEIPKVEDLILKYIRLCFSKGSKINLAKNNDIIILVDKYCRKVTYEAHRFTGFVRFKEIGPNIFYSSIEPDHNILPLLINHFSKRFSDQYFIIHDIKREIAIIYNKKNSIISDFTKNDSLYFSDYNKEVQYEDLWKTFYDSINIKERKNLKQRNGFMPKRYWSHLTEISNR